MENGFEITTLPWDLSDNGINMSTTSEKSVINLVI